MLRETSKARASFWTVKPHLLTEEDGVLYAGRNVNSYGEKTLHRGHRLQINIKSNSRALRLETGQNKRRHRQLASEGRQEGGS